MAALVQGGTGEWMLTIKHNIPGNLVIPATFTFSGISKTVYIRNTEQTIKTDWITEVGTTININEMRNGVPGEPDDVAREYTAKSYNGRVYTVTDEEFEVIPYSGSTGSETGPIPDEG